MGDLMRELYDSVPASVQNALITAKGYSLAFSRYRREYRDYVSSLMRSQWFGLGEFSELQEQLLRELLTEANTSTAFYSSSLQPWRGSLHHFSLRNLHELPIVEPQFLRRNARQFLNHERVRRYGADQGHTSGTSGAPFVWPYDWDSMRRNLAFRERQYRWAGLTGRELSARLSGRVLLGRRSRPPYWRYNGAERQWFFSVYHMNPDTLPIYYEQLSRIAPRYLDGYPSAIFQLAQWVNAHGLSASCRTWAVITTAEMLTPPQRREVEQAFGCRVFDYYSSSEGAPYITQCEAGGKHVNPEAGIVEILKDDGEPARPGELGTMVVTSFFQRTLPLIRYRIGDTARYSVSGIACPCGRAMPLIEDVEGRERDCLVTADGRVLGSAGLSTALYCIPSRIHCAQIEQTGGDRFVVRYVPSGSDLTPQEQATLLKALRDRLGTSAVIDVDVVADIPRTARGKMRLVIGKREPKIGCAKPSVR